MSRAPAARPASPWLRTSASVSQAATSRSLVVSASVFSASSRTVRQSGVGSPRIRLARVLPALGVARLGARIAQPVVRRGGGEVLADVDALRRVARDRRQQSLEVETLRQIRHSHASHCWTMVPRNT